eukprot:scaffold137781_cov22-Tisochrysis_lutea.AAC.1
MDISYKRCNTQHTSPTNDAMQHTCKLAHAFCTCIIVQPKIHVAKGATAHAITHLPGYGHAGPTWAKWHDCVGA